MKRLLASLLCLAPAASFALGTRTWTEAQSATRSAPSSILDGMALSDVTGLRVFVKRTSGTALSTSCWLRAYVWSDSLGAWARSASGDADGNGLLDWEIGTADVGKTVPLAFPDQQPVARRGRILYATDGCDALTVVIEAVTL